MLLNKKSADETIKKSNFFGLKFVSPEAVLKQIELRPGMKVADFGCGAGFFSLPIARLIGEKGLVYALDVVPQKLEAVGSQAKAQSVYNIETRRVDLEIENGSGLESESVDWVIMKDMLFQNKNKSQILKEARRVLKIGGRVLIIEWKSEDFTVGPTKDLRMYKESLIELSKNSGFNFLKEIEANNFHYGLILEK
jgi:ubiquinone/menaquinone biosynthesis C-methylase UbiE